MKFFVKYVTRSIWGNNLKRHSNKNIKYKETLEQNTSLNIDIAKYNIKHGGSTHEEDCEKDNYNTEVEQMEYRNIED